MNQLKQIALATHHFAANNRDYLPNVNGFNYNTRQKDSSLFLLLMPYIEQGNLYAAYKAEYGGSSGSNMFVAKPFLSPVDPSLPTPPYGVSSYAANAVLFGPWPNLQQIADGSSQTVAFAEHYANNCSGIQFSWFVDEIPVPFPSAPGGNRLLRSATFAAKQFGDIHPVSSGVPASTHSSRSGLTFQVRPALSDCDPRMAQTPHKSGMLVALADGSVRCLSPGMSETTYWSAITPSAGDQLGFDW
jgi:hypothetical protein